MNRLNMWMFAASQHIHAAANRDVTGAQQYTKHCREPLNLFNQDISTGNTNKGLK